MIIKNHNNPNLSHNIVSSTHRHERYSNSQRWWLYALIAQVVVNPTTIRSRPLWYHHIFLCVFRGSYEITKLSNQQIFVITLAGEPQIWEQSIKMF
jgi:hypothetical protein